MEYNVRCIILVLLVTAGYSVLIEGDDEAEHTNGKHIIFIFLPIIKTLEQ